MHECREHDFEERIKKYDFKKAKEFYKDILSFKVCPQGLNKLIEYHINELNIVDIREYDDYIDGHIPYAIHVPFDELEEHLDMFDKKKMTVVYSYCKYSLKAVKAAYMLADKDYPVIVLLGGFKAWEKAGFDTVKTSATDDK